GPLRARPHGDGRGRTAGRGRADACGRHARGRSGGRAERLHRPLPLLRPGRTGARMTEARTTTRTLVAGAGNIFLRDDGFGPAVAVRLLAEGPPEDGVTVVDYGIRGVHLAYELLNGYDTLIIIDAVRRGDPPGTLHVIEPDGSGAGAAPVDGHDMTPET